MNILLAEGRPSIHHSCPPVFGGPSAAGFEIARTEDDMQRGTTGLGAAVLGALFSLMSSAALGEGGPNTSAQAAYVLWPDGMAVKDVIPPTTGLGTKGTPQWFRFAAGARRSYDVEIFQLMNDGINYPAQAQLDEAFSNVQATIPVSFNDYSYADPSGGDYNPPAIRRYVIRDLATSTPVFLKIDSGLNYETGDTQTFQLRIVDTTLVAARVSTTGYDAFVALHNSADNAVSASIYFYDEAGTLIGSRSQSIGARGSAQLVYSRTDATYGGHRGSIEVTYDGALGSVDGHVYHYNPATQQYGPQFPLQAARSWGRGSY